MAVPTPIDKAELEFDNGSFDSGAFAAQALTSWQALAAIIDHTLLKPDATRKQVENLCDEAARYQICMRDGESGLGFDGGERPLGYAASLSARSLAFRFGASLVSTLRQEAAALARLGARELDMVIPIGVLKSGNHHAVHHTVHAAATVAHHHGALLKVILETAMLSMEEKLRGAEIAIHAGADFIKTSTGFGGGGRNRGRRGADARRGGRTLRRKGFGRHPHAGRSESDARSRRQPHRNIRICRDCAGTRRGVS